MPAGRLCGLEILFFFLVGNTLDDPPCLNYHFPEIMNTETERFDWLVSTVTFQKIQVHDNNKNNLK